MTDNEIKQALPFLAKYCKNEYNDIRVDEVLLGASDLINRQKAEIKDLKKDINHYKINLPYLEHQNEDFCGVPCSFMENLVEKARAEAIKEFAGKVRRYIKSYCNPYGEPTLDYDTSLKIMHFIDNLVKEKVGDAV